MSDEAKRAAFETDVRSRYPDDATQLDRTATGVYHAWDIECEWQMFGKGYEAGYEVGIAHREERAEKVEAWWARFFKKHSRDIASDHRWIGVAGFNAGAESERERAEKAEAALEVERMRLVACGVVALADTPDSAATDRKMAPEYESGSLHGVIRRVDECIKLRAELAALRERVRTALTCDVSNAPMGETAARMAQSWLAAKIGTEGL